MDLGDSVCGVQVLFLGGFSLVPFSPKDFGPQYRAEKVNLPIIHIFGLIRNVSSTSRMVLGTSRESFDVSVAD